MRSTPSFPDSFWLSVGLADLPRRPEPSLQLELAHRGWEGGGCRGRCKGRGTMDAPRVALSPAQPSEQRWGREGAHQGKSR